MVVVAGDGGVVQFDGVADGAAAGAPAGAADAGMGGRVDGEEGSVGRCRGDDAAGARAHGAVCIGWYSRLASWSRVCGVEAGRPQRARIDSTDLLTADLPSEKKSGGREWSGLAFHPPTDSAHPDFFRRQADLFNFLFIYFFDGSKNKKRKKLTDWPGLDWAWDGLADLGRYRAQPLRSKSCHLEEPPSSDA